MRQRSRYYRWRQAREPEKELAPLPWRLRPEEQAAILPLKQAEPWLSPWPKGLKHYTPWIFCSEAGTPLDPNKVDKVFKRGLKAAGLPLHFTPHCWRHTFASLLQQERVRLTTVDTYGR